MSTSQQTLSPFNEHLVRQYEIPRGMIRMLVADFTDEEATRRAGDLKPLVWFLGHIITTEAHFLDLYGPNKGFVDKEHAKRFGRGSDGTADFSDASREELIGVLDNLRKEFIAVLSTLTPEDLTRETEASVGHPLFKTLGSALALVVSHDGYHAGQIADLRRALGKDPLFG